MVYIEIFRFVQLAIIAVFAACISDFRKKKGMTPLVNEKATLVLKLSYLIPLAIYAYVVFTLNSISVLDIAAISVTILGASITLKAKIDLAKHHTWTGYCLESPKLVTKGIYAYVRHPLYVGIYVFSIGGFLTMIQHTPLLLSVIALGTSIYIMFFLGFLAVKESNCLSEKLGNVYLEYKKQVHPCLPLRKYCKKIEKET